MAAATVQHQLARQLEEARLMGDQLKRQLGEARDSMRRCALAMAQMAAIDNTGPLLARSMAEAVLLITVYIALLHYSAHRWHRLSGVPDPFSRVSPLVPTTITVGYLAFVYYGSRFMRLRRAAFSARIFECMLVYNLYQLALNVCCTLAFVQEVRRQRMAVWGNRRVYTEDQYHLSFLIWLHYNNTYFELLDTAFILLRKKFRRITFLHVYQRLLMVWSWFIVCKFACGGDSYFPAVVHSAVHVVTYSYYLLAILQCPLPRKERVTFLHIAEGLLCVMQALYVLYKGNMPAVLAIIQLFVMLNMLVLFTDFHYRRMSTLAVDTAPQAHAPRIVFSFDSSGWLFLYHFGVAKYLREEYLPREGLPPVAYSGASGGALVATALCSGANLPALIENVIASRKDCYRTPWRLMGIVDAAIAKFLPPGAHETCFGKVRVLTTKVLPQPPFVMGEVTSDFQSQQHLAQVLRASCHVPLVGGVLPYRMTAAAGGWYWDGLFWSSGLGFVPWRSESPEDTVMRVSGLGVWGAQIKPEITLPPWWTIVPPREETLAGMVAQGYWDAARVLGPSQAVSDPLALPEPILQFQEAVFRSWMVTIVAMLGAVTLLFTFWS